MQEEYQFDLNRAIEDKCEITVAKGLLERLGNDQCCDLIINIAAMMNKEDKKWIVSTIEGISK